MTAWLNLFINAQIAIGLGLPIRIQPTEPAGRRSDVQLGQ